MDYPARRANRVVLRQAECRRDVVRRAHGHIPDRGRRVELHEPGEHLAERAVPTDAGDRIKVRSMARGKLRRISSARGEEQRRPVAAEVERMQRFGEIHLIPAASRRGVYYEHQFLFHVSPLPLANV